MCLDQRLGKLLGLLVVSYEINDGVPSSNVVDELVVCLVVGCSTHE